MCANAQNFKMGIADEIRKTIQEKLVIKYVSNETDDDQPANCVICATAFINTTKFSLYLPGEGYLCNSCGQKFAPQMASLLEIKPDSLVKKDDCTMEILPRDILTTQEWQEIYHNLERLLEATSEIAKGLSRGIIEAPAGHIGLLHFAKDVVRPHRKELESEKDYELRVKTYRIRKIYEKIRQETTCRVELLQRYLYRMGMPLPDQKEES